MQYRTHETIERFLAISWLYMQLTDVESARATAHEVCELLEAINASNEPVLDGEQGVA